MRMDPTEPDDREPTRARNRQRLPGRLAALGSILAEWTSADRSANRAAKISSGAIAGGYRLDATTTVDDGVVDTLTGVGRPTGS
jgi:hypothetical protein